MSARQSLFKFCCWPGYQCIISGKCTASNSH